MINKGLIDALKELEAEYRKRAKESELFDDRTLKELADYTKTFRVILEKKFLEDAEALIGVKKEE